MGDCPRGAQLVEGIGLGVGDNILESDEGVAGFTESATGSIRSVRAVLGQILQVSEDTARACDMELKDVDRLPYEGRIF